MKKTISSLQLGMLYFYVHFSVEVACFYFLFSRLNSSPIWWGLALLFDALAFVSQGFIGLIADRFPRVNYGLLGCSILLISLMIPLDIVALILLCIGNALAHIGGAQVTLRTSGGSIAPTGAFVGGGSFGVITGQLLGLAQKSGLLIIPVSLMLIAILLLAFVAWRYTARPRKWQVDITTNHSATVIMLVAFAVVAIRAYIGYAIPTEWRKTDLQAILLFFMMGVGKTAGGFLADKIGHYTTAWISSLAALPFLLFGNSNMVLSLIGVGLFSMTMPITIAILVSKFPQQPCFAFGVTTIALFAGTLPAFFIRPTTLPAHQLTVLILILIATIALVFCIEKRKKHEMDTEDHPL